MPSSRLTRSVRTVMRAALDRLRVHVDRADRRLPRPRPRASSSSARAAPLPASFGSTPRSKRALASERRPSRFDVRAMPLGSKYADSSRISVVASETSAAAPPMIPAMPCGDPLAVADQQVVRA